ncbi:MAG TPA: CheR family methyltransferase [Longimicrobiales bacterium]|nr:CheR family methyltransferase [Longimicrobiales bacterium]
MVNPSRLVPPDDVLATDEEFYLLNELIERSFGISFPEHMRDALFARLRPRVRALHLTSFHEYYLRLVANLGSELDQLAVLVTNNETYFFRGRNHFEALTGEGIELLEPGLVLPGTLRILVAGCSSGEEAYTLSFYLTDRRRDRGGPRAHIDAFDVDSVRVAMCNHRVYRPRSLRDTTEAEVSRYLRSVHEDHWEVKPEYAQGLAFTTGNIMKRESFQSYLPYDVVFCRNVLIYFSQDAIRRAIENFASVLRPGGLLFLGHSESIAGLSSSFEMVRVSPCIVYRRLPG